MGLSFMAKMCKMIISPGVFFNVKILIFQFVKGLKGQKKWSKISKISVCCTLHFRNHISYDLHLWYTCMYKRIISPGILSQELYIIWLWFLVHMCKVMISPANLLIFQNFDFGFFRRIKGKITNYQFQFVLLYISGTVDHIIRILIMISTGVFLYFSFFLKMQLFKY